MKGNENSILHYVPSAVALAIGILEMLNYNRSITPKNGTYLFDI